MYRDLVLHGECRVTTQSYSKHRPLCCLLAFPALFCCCSGTLARPVAMLVLSRLGTGMAQPSVFFFHLQVSHREIQPTLLLEVLMLLPSLQVLPQLVGHLGQGCQNRAWQLSRWLWTHVPGIRCFTAAANRLSPAPSCALPCLKPSTTRLMVSFLTERYSHWPAGSFQRAVCALQLKTTSTSAPDIEKVLKQWQSWTSSYHHQISLHCISSVFKIRRLCIASVNGTVCCLSLNLLACCLYICMYSAALADGCHHVFLH